MGAHARPHPGLEAERRIGIELTDVRQADPAPVAPGDAGARRLVTSLLRASGPAGPK